VFGQMFALDGSPIGALFPITSHQHGAQAMRAACGTARLAFNTADDLLCAWNGDGGFGDSSAAHISLLSAAPIDLHGQVQGVTSDMKAAPSRTEQLVAMIDGPQPHKPPTFDPTQIEKGTRQVITSLTDVGFSGVFNTGWTPPDPSLAVGPNNVAVMTNGAIAFFSKTGTAQFQDEIEGVDGFWGSVGATDFVFDPEILYDPISSRFFAMASEQAPGGQSFILIAVSDDSNPNGNWFKYRFNTTSLAGGTFDSPNMSVDANVVYITGDKTGGSGYPVFTYDKPSLLAGNPPAITRSVLFASSVQSAGIPPVSFDNPPALYMIEHKEAASNTQVRLIALTDPLGTPTFATFNLTVPTYGPPEDPPQMGTTVRPETFDARFWSAAYRNGSLWATHHINSTRVLARWYQVAMNGWPTSGQFPSLVQSGTIDPGAGIRTFFSAITVDQQGNAALVFARSSSNEFISMQTAYRFFNDPPGTFQAPVQRQINTGPYSQNRWGDYGGMNVDPEDNHTMWAHHEYTVAGSWHTWIQSFYPGAPPCSLDIAPSGGGNGIVDVDDLLAVINAWGPCANPNDCPADVAPPGGNDIVNVDDLLAIINAWGPC